MVVLIFSFVLLLQSDDFIVFQEFKSCNLDDGEDRGFLEVLDEAFGLSLIAQIKTSWEEALNLQQILIR